MKGSRATKGQMKNEAMDYSEENMKKIESSFKEIADKMFKSGMPAKDALGINNNVLEGIYAQAYRLYNTGKYVEATHLFRMLIVMNSTEAKYLLGLAACFHMLKEYRNAIQTYTMCAMIEANNPIPFYHSSDCFIQMKDYLSAILCLEMAIKQAGDRPEFAKLKERALLSLESLKKQQQQTGTETEATEQETPPSQ